MNTTTRRPAFPGGRTAAAAVAPLLALALALAASLAVPAAAQRQAPPLELPAWETAHPFASIPHPRDVFGFEPGADYRLATNDQIVEYFRRLDAASDRVSVTEIGRSVQGRPMIMAAISSAENIRNLDRIRETAEALARGRIGADEAGRRIAEGKAVVWIDGGLHATEVAGAQHTPLLAYRVAGEESAEMRRIRDDVVLLLMPVMNPDGLDLVADWTARGRGTAWEGSSPPVLYQFYTGHDNNRDWFMITQPETKAVTDVIYHQWYPQIVLNQHQTAPFPARIFIPPFEDPVNPNIPPLVVRGVNAVGAAMGERFSAENKPGAISQITFDMWWNGGMRTAPYYHNMVGLLTETAHASVAPQYTSPEAVSNRTLGNLPADQPSIMHPHPWTGGWFRLRDAVEYMITAAVATVDIGSRLREDWLTNIWTMGRDAIAAGEGGGPFAYVIPPDQRNPREAVEMVNVLRRGGVEVHRATRSFQAGGEAFPAGSYVALAGQAFRPHLMDLMERQRYPDMRLYAGGPPDPPYDISGWTLPIQMDVRTVRIDEPLGASALRAAALEPVDQATVWPGEVAGNGRWGWVAGPSSNAVAIAANRLLAAGEQVSIADAPVRVGNRTYGAGAIVVRSGSGTPARVRELATELGVRFDGLASEPGVALRRLDRPRVGLYKSWQANMDEGWTRWIMEQYEFPVDTLHDAEIRTADLSRYHAIILPDQSARGILHGYAAGTRPAEITGGIGLEGVVRLRDYVRNGGRLIAFDGATDLLIEQFGLPVRNTVAGLPSDRFFIPGTLVRIELEQGSDLTRGMGESAAASFVRSSAFSVGSTSGWGADEGGGEDIEIVARYARDDLVLSGWALGADDHLAGRAAVLRVPMGAGDLVLFGFRPQFRAQPRGTMKMVFNALHGAAAQGLARETAGESGR